MPIVKVKGGYKVRSYSTGRLLKRRYKTRRAAERAANKKRKRGTDLWGRWY